MTRCRCAGTPYSLFSPVLASCGFRKLAPPTILAWEDGCFPLRSTLEAKTAPWPRIWSGSNSASRCWSTCSGTTGSLVVPAPAQEFVGLCPLHQETRPSFYVNARKNLFYCHGCGRGGDLIRFVQLFLDLPFRQTVAHLEAGTAPAPVSRLLEQTAAFYQLQLHRHPEAAALSGAAWIARSRT